MASLTSMESPAYSRGPDRQVSCHCHRNYIFARQKLSLKKRHWLQTQIRLRFELAICRILLIPCSQLCCKVQRPEALHGALRHLLPHWRGSHHWRYLQEEWARHAHHWTHHAGSWGWICQLCKHQAWGGLYPCNIQSNLAFSDDRLVPSVKIILMLVLCIIRYP